MTKSKIMPVEDAVALIKSGMTLAVGGAGGVQEPDALIEALVERFKRTGEPRDLVEIHAIRTGEIEGRGTSLFGAKGLVRRMIGGSFWPVGVPELIRRINADEMEAYNFSIGVIYAMLEAAAAKRPGVVSRVGLGTFQDPDRGGGALNAISREKLVQAIEIEGERLLYYKAPAVDVALIRATSADADGNLTFEEEPALIGGLLLAQAARANGGKVIAQVKRIASPGSLRPHDVRVPGVLVDAVVVSEGQRQITHCFYDPTLTGEETLPLSAIERRPMDAGKVVMRRAFLEAQNGDLLAIGFGIAGFLPAVAIEEDVFDLVTFTIEHGVFGGINGYAAGGKTFPVAHNPVAILEAPDQLRFFAGGGINRAFLGVGEVDAKGNVNVSRFGERIPGAGGFVEMTQGIENIVFCMVLGDKAARKVVVDVQDMTFNAAEAAKRGQNILYVSEKAVFRLTDRGLTLVEIAPGLDVERDILAHLGTEIAVAENLRTIPDICFSEECMGLRERWLAGNLYREHAR
ncbi:CoA-transferase [Sinorhizobium psoraleae]|uniref:CoA-transferase n=1 Tax=Sinorhizobium psoraleae TaxID=520838 RepID=UPI00156803DC|nr:CoA-transferase [Sinorhizobium psoraleae]